MKDVIAKLTAIPGVQLNPPASPSEIAAVEARLDIQLPREVRDFYSISNGAMLGPCLEVPSLAEACNYCSSIPGKLFGSMLVVVNFESDPFCVFHSGPLQGYVAQVFHDGDSHVRWRSLGSLLQQLALNLTPDGQLDEQSILGELDTPSRLASDVAAGRSMVEYARTLETHSTESPFAFGFAFDLLGEDQVPEIAAYLEHEDRFVGRIARDRLGQMNCTEAKEVLARHWNEVKDTMSHIATLLKNSGYQATLVKEVNVRIDPGPNWLDWEGLMTHRHKPDFDELVLNIARHRPNLSPPG
jgi:hypothetical protein